MLKSNLAFLFICIAGSCFSQKEASWWFFGYNGGVEFTTGTPLPAPGGMINQMEGTSSVSDSITGNLLFYSDGVKVWDASHTIMPHGTGLMGNGSTTQFLIVPQPGGAGKYYLFTADAHENNNANGYRYSVVDMSLNAGMGDVINASKNTLLLTPCNEQISAVRHANCTDWWIMLKGLENNNYYAYLLTSAGLTGPVISSIGLSTPSPALGQAKFSPNGKRYAIATFGFVQLFDFNNATGLLSNALTLYGNVANFPFTYSYGLSFSGDNSKLYVMHGGVGANIYQYNVKAGSNAAILASATYIDSADYIPQMQLGPDGKIYITHFSGTSLSVINYPNVSGPTCGFALNAIPISGYCNLGLPNFPDSYFNQFPCGYEEPEEPKPALVIPNIITPNGDGVNDYFVIPDLPADSKLYIFNRWGSEVFTTEAYDNTWSVNEDGVYYYVLSLPDANVVKGFVHVVRE